MKTFKIKTEAGEEKTYIDYVRYLWALSFLVPLVVMWIVLSLPADPSFLDVALSALMPILLVPIIEYLLGRNKRGPERDFVKVMEADVFYRWVLYASIPVYYGVVVSIAYYASSASLNVAEYVLLAVAAGIYGSISVAPAHELGHSRKPYERVLSRVLLGLTAMAHFAAHHYRVHHRHVATPLDASSARLGESVYAFVLREIPDSLRDGWNEECLRLGRMGISKFSIKNEIIQTYSITLTFHLLLIALFGLSVIPLLIIQSLVTWVFFSATDYLQHYGLLREQMPSGRYEHCQPHHSWNAEYLLGNLRTFNVERHSDHHANPSRQYQVLRSEEGLPTVPYPYMIMILCATIPPLWFRLMDHRVLGLSHVAGDIDKVHIHAEDRTMLIKKYNLTDYKKGSENV